MRSRIPLQTVPRKDRKPQRMTSIDPIIDQMLEDEQIGSREEISWSTYTEMAERIQARIASKVTLKSWDYVHPPRLQISTPARLRKARNVRAAYTCFGGPSTSTLICLGGIANVARRFDCLARHLGPDRQVVAMDWVGRGRSGWLPEQADYSQETLIEQVLQLIAHLGATEVSFVGSSLGGSVAMAIAARRPELVRSLILNDIGPFMPAKRRSRRAQSVARHYVFRHPIDLFRRTGAAQKNDGPVDDATLLCNSFHMTKWSDDEGGRIYRYDPRALAAYRGVAAKDLDQWHDWHRVSCPVMVVHGMCSDALTSETIDRMVATGGADVIHVPDTGHTPTLTESDLLDAIADWLSNPVCMGRQTVMARVPFPPRVLFSNDPIQHIPATIEAAA